MNTEYTASLEQTLAKAIDLHQAGQIQDAEQLYREILKTHPSQPNASHNLAIIEQEAKHIEDSLALFRTALESDPDEQQYWVSYIDALIQAGQLAQAKEVLQYGLEGGLSGPDVEVLASQLNVTQAKSEQRPKNNQKNPDSAEMQQLVNLFNQGDLIACESLSREMTQSFPKHGFAWKVLGTLLQQTGRPQEAIKALTQAATLLTKDEEVQFNLGNTYLDCQQLDAAKNAYKKAIKLNPQFDKAHFNLACILKDQQHTKEAQEHLRKAIQINPNNVSAHYQLALTLHQEAKFEGAENAFKKTIALMPNMAEAHYFLANTMLQLQRFDEAQTYFLRAIEIKPQYADAYAGLSIAYQANQQLELAEQALRESIFIDPNAYIAINNLGNLLKASGRFQEAESCYMQALSIQPEFAAGYNNLGLVLRDQARLEDAAAAFLCALQHNPNLVPALNNLGLVYKETGRIADAKTQYQKALEINPEYAQAYCNLGMAYEAEGNFVDAEIALLNALKYQPNFAEALNNLGIVYKSQWRLQDAEAYLKQAVAAKPDYVEAYSNLGSTLKDAGKLTEAEEAYRKALALNPNYYQAMSNLLFCLTHNAEIDKVSLYAEHVQFGHQFEAPLKAKWQAHTLDKTPTRTLNIGFVSADLRAHAVAYFIEPIIVHLSNYPHLNLFAYANSLTHDNVSQRLQAHFKTWRNVARLSDDALAETIRNDQIDILIDLSGHTAGHRLLTFARKPAPIQASWIGYPGTTGLTAMDYFLADKYLLPPNQLDDQFTEKLVQLPASAPFMPQEDAPPVNALPALQNGYITFGSFNRPSKLSQTVISLWAELMHAVPNSKILMGAMSVEGENSQVLSWFEQAGITADRIQLHQRSSMQHYLQLHHQVDICLDTFPYNGGTTTWHAIWMGVPTITIAGDMLPSRIGAGILGHVGLDRFVVRNANTFIEEGVFWSQHIDELAIIRSGLRARFAQSPPGNPSVIASGLERAFRQMWQYYCQDLAAESFEITMQEVNLYPAIKASPAETNTPIFVTQPLLPELKDYVPYLEQIWKNKFLTNGGPFHQQLERELCDYLGVKHIALFTNGTLALLTALQSLRITGEVITTPYSFVATAHSLLWNSIKPVFVDIDPVSLNMDPAKIVAAITPQTTAIMPVHCYGHPCDVEAIQKIADDYNLKVIYDAAHAFGVRKDGESVLLHGDLSVLSFHATKVFNTFEGGAIICPDAKTKTRIDHLKNFGFVDEQTVVATGINGKMSEINAAFGLLQLKGIDAALQKRKEIDVLYRQQLSNIEGIVCIPSAGEDVANYSYFPILVKSNYPIARDALYQKLRDAGIYARRYFYPLISDFPMYRGLPSAAHDNLSVARQAANEVICLPIFPELTTAQITRIVDIIRY